MTLLRNSVQSEEQNKSTMLANTLRSNSGLIVRSKLEKSSCIGCRLQNSCLSKNQSPSVLRRLSEIVKIARPLKNDSHLYRQADQFESLYIIKCGFVKSYVADSEGNELAVSFFMPGEIIGLDGLYSKQYSSSIVALQDTLICEIPYEALETLCATEPALQKHFNELQSRQILQEQEMTMLRGQKTAANRLFAFLMHMSNRYKRQNLSPVSFRLPMTRKDIGGCLGLTFETVSRLFTVLQKQEILIVKGKDVTLTNLKPRDVLSH